MMVKDYIEFSRTFVFSTFHHRTFVFSPPWFRYFDFSPWYFRVFDRRYVPSYFRVFDRRYVCLDGPDYRTFLQNLYGMGREVTLQCIFKILSVWTQELPPFRYMSRAKGVWHKNQTIYYYTKSTLQRGLAQKLDYLLLY